MELLLLFLLWAGPRSHSGGQVHVRGTLTKRGTYRQPHFRTSPDGMKTNNWSSQGNKNPWTGKSGYKSSVKPAHHK